MTRIALALALLTTGPAHAGEPSDLARATAALSVRHDPPSCAALVAALAHPAATLSALVASTDTPPWVPLRAARCAAGLPDAEPAVRRWLVDAARPGLAEVIVTALRDVEPVRAEALARVALAGPHADRVRAALVTSDVDALRRLVERP